jgi:hypothetical protein
MILEFAQGAVRQIGRFIGGLPRAFGWSGAGGTVSPGGQVCGVLTIAPRVSGTVSIGPRVSGTTSVYPRVNGSVTIGEC